MKNVFILFIIIGFTFSSCKKNEEIPIPAFADRSFTLLDFQMIGDSASSEFTFPGSIILKRDLTWTIDLDGAISNGEYSWVPIADNQAEIKFRISYWAENSSHPLISDKLKSTLQLVNFCGYSLEGQVYVNFMLSDYYGDDFPFLRTYQ